MKESIENKVLQRFYLTDARTSAILGLEVTKMKTKKCYESHTSCNGNYCKFERCLFCKKMRSPRFHLMTCTGAWESEGYDGDKAKKDLTGSK